jgi:DNA repair protein SbcC/Rad50
MKILHLKFKNINSLAGENEIDFTKPVFTNDGLFAITGKTGAGKSSILDAISLALYGRTPRVEITSSENAVMTKGEKDCYAEIHFEVAGKKWKSSWKQELNRSGNLKPVHRTIADANNHILADQLRSCDSKIIEIVGLTFIQFTKVIMLAQGSFAAFLQADKNEKGELLEQITGTEIYAQISKKVFEQNRAEKEKLEKVLVELEAIKILSEEEIKNLTNEIAAFEKDKKQIDDELQKLETVKKWFLDVENLEKNITEAKQKLPLWEEKTIKANENLEKTENDLNKAKEEQKKLVPIFNTVRELDTKISEKEKLLQPILKAMAELEKSKNELSASLERQNADLKKSQDLLIEKQNWATANKKYEELVSNYTAIEQENQLLVISSNEIKNLNAEIAILQKNVALKNAKTQKTEEEYLEIQNLLTVKSKELETKKSELLEILGGNELSVLQSEKVHITNFGTKIKSLLEVENALEKNRIEIADCLTTIENIQHSEIELSKKMADDVIVFTNLEIRINLLDENIKLSKTIQSLDEHRQHLKDGEACPLCGSLEHPFALGNLPQMGEKEKELATLKKIYQETADAIRQDEKTQTKLVADKENTKKNKQKAEESLAENKAKQIEILTAIKNLKSDFSLSNAENKLHFLTEIYKQKQNEYKKVDETIKKAMIVEKLIATLRDEEIPAFQNQKQAAEKNKNEVETALKLAQQQLVEKQKTTTTSQQKYETENNVFLVKLKSYHVDHIDKLKNCLDAWNANTKQIEDLTSRMAMLSSQIAVHNKELENQTKAWDEKQKDKEGIATDKQKLTDDRKAIFANKSVEEEEQRLRKCVEDAELAKTKAANEKNYSNTELEKYRAIVTEKEKEFLTLKKQEVTEKTIEEIQKELDGNKIKADDFLQKMGANNQTLKANAENLINSRDKIKEKEKQQAIATKWANLNELIGSGDGKKYRNFAQALTFEHLTGLSNIQLQKMSDRYLLKRINDSSNPFELSVIDKFQNSEQRTAQNLSGGEKFIVSLSLALGLANMASKNMRVDTMFIDEGFGTLDADYLDVALNALSNLQSEGKVIGVISHLTELKERIATHIEVVPSGNGHSKIQITN